MTKPELFEIDGHKIAALLLNPGIEGEPFIFLHGITASLHAWMGSSSQAVMTLGPCYSVSLPGHYPAAFPEGFSSTNLTPETIADVLANAIRQLTSEKPATLIGHSTGGFSALSVAIYHPELVSRVVSVSGFAHGRWIGALGFYQKLVRSGALGTALFKWLYRSVRSYRLLRAVMRIYVADVPALYRNPELDDLVKAALPDFCLLDLDAIAMYFQVMPNTNITPLLHKISIPVLAMVGDNDPTVPPEQAHVIVEHIEGAELAVFNGVGHLISTERPAHYQARLSDWLRINNA
jgi:pimeloyl-ACP methyl ester carboxylesterase